MKSKEAFVHQPPKRDRSQAGEAAAPQAATALSKRIAAGPMMAAQRKAIDRMTVAGEPIQRQAELEDEEMLQGKFAAQLELEDEEDLMQGAFDVPRPRAAGKTDA